MGVGRLRPIADQLVDVLGFHEKRYKPGQGRGTYARIRRALHPVVIKHDVDDLRFFYPLPADPTGSELVDWVPTLRQVWSDLCADENRHSVHWWQTRRFAVWDNRAVVHLSVTEDKRNDRFTYRTFTVGSQCDQRVCLGLEGMSPIQLSSGARIVTVE